MKRMIPIIMAMGLLSGCVLPKAFALPGVTPAEERARWIKDYAECEEVAYEAWSRYWYKDTGVIVSMPRNIPPDSIAGMFIDDKRIECLNERGWRRVDLPEPN